MLLRPIEGPLDFVQADSFQTSLGRGYQGHAQEEKPEDELWALDEHEVGEAKKRSQRVRVDWGLIAFWFVPGRAERE